MDNICHLLNNFLRCSACENVIFCWVILKRNPKAIVLDSKAKKEKELEWIDRIEEFDAFMND